MSEPEDGPAPERGTSDDARSGPHEAQDDQDVERRARPVGHGEHIREAERRGLAGAMPRPVQGTMVGAGSMFTPELAKDLFRIPDHRGGTIALVDIDERRLATMAKLVE